MKETVFLKESNDKSTLTISSSNAGYIINRANEELRETSDLLKGLSFMGESMDVLGSTGTPKVTKIGKDAEFFKTISETLERRGKLKILIAWLREAEKTKESLRKAVEGTDFEDYCMYVMSPESKEAWKNLLENEPKDLESFAEWLRDNPVSFDKPIAPIEPVLGDIQELLDKMGIKERFEYIQTEQMAAEYGKTGVHSEGVLKKAKDEFFEKLGTPITKVESSKGGDILIEYHTPTVEASELEDFYASLQGVQRSYEASLNGKKQVLMSKQEKKYTAEMEAFHKAQEEYNILQKKWNDEYLQKKSEFHDLSVKKDKEIQQWREAKEPFKTAWKLWVTTETSVISRSRVVIPNDLKDIFEELNKDK